MTNYLNCTPHAITIFEADGEHVIATIPPSGVVIRVEEELVRQDDGTYLVLTRSAEPDVPDVPEGGRVIVSRVVAEARRGSDSPLVFPVLHVRDEDGRIIGCRGFGRLPS